MEILNICGKKMVVGLEWEIIPQDVAGKIDKAMREIAVKNGCKYGLHYTFQGTTAAGFTNKSFSDAPGAFYLAFAHQIYLTEVDREDPNARNDWIYIDRDGEAGKYWMCVIKEGIPTPGFDVVSTEFKDIKEKIQDILRVDTYIFHSPLSEVSQFLYEKGFSTPVEKKNFEDLTLGIDLKKIKKLARYKKLVGIPPILMIIGAFLVIALLTFFVYGDWQAEQKKKKSAQNRAKTEMQEKTKEEFAYSEAVKKYYEDYFQKKEEAFNKVKPIFGMDSPSTLKSWTSVLDFKIPTSGWSIADVKCEVSDKNIDAEKLECVKDFVRGPNTTNKMLLDSEENAFLTSPMAATAKSEYKMPITKTNFSIDNYKFMNLDEFAINFVSDMQKLKYNEIEFTIDKSPEEITFTPGTIPLTKQQIEAGVKSPSVTALKIGYAKGNFSLKGGGFKKLLALLDSMNWRSFSVKGLNIINTSYSSIAWDLQIDYVIKTTSDNLTPPKVDKYSAETFGLPKPKP